MIFKKYQFSLFLYMKYNNKMRIKNKNQGVEYQIGDIML